MARKRPGKTKTSTRRRVAVRRAAPAVKHDTVAALLHELQVHAEEITVQNEQLLKAQAELEETRDRFADLYDFAPIVYLTIDRRGVITDINLAGETLFGRERTFLINMPLSSIIDRERRAALDEFLSQSRHAGAGGSRVLELKGRTDPPKVLRLIARRHPAEPGLVFMAVVDITDERMLENERRVAFELEQQRGAELKREIAERSDAEARVKALLERLVTAQEEERRRIARNLHDHLGQQMTALHLTLSALNDDGSMSDEAKRRLELAEQIVKKLDRDIDLLAWDLRPAALTDIGLSSALADLVRQWTMVTQVPAEFHESTPEVVVLLPEIAANIYRIVQEALNNIAKHASASHVSVLLEQRKGETTVIVEDNGRGFDPELQQASRARHGGMGLVGMRERAALIDGDLQIESKPGVGTTVFVRIPVTPSTQGTESTAGANSTQGSKGRKR